MKKIGFFVLICFLLASCGNKEDEEQQQKCTATISPSTTSISGDLSEYFEVVDDTATIDEGGFFGPIISIKIKKIKEIDFDAEGYKPVGYFGESVFGNYGFGITIKDKDGNVVKEVNATASGVSGCYSGDDLISIWEEEVGEENIVRWSSQELCGKDGELYFTISSFKKEVTPTESSSASVSDNNTGVEYSDAEVDRMLNDLENMLKQLAKMDELSVAYAKKEEQILALSEKITKAHLSSSQELRFLKLVDRFDDL